MRDKEKQKAWSARRYQENKADMNAKSKEWKAANPERKRELDAARRVRNREHLKVQARARIARDPEKYAAIAHQNYEKSKEKKKKKYEANRLEKIAYSVEWNNRNLVRKRELNRESQRRNPADVVARCAKRNASKKKASPAWADHAEILKFYENAERLTRETGIPHEVDHIVPLQSTIVCGLHCQANLQVITAAENRKKSNKHWPDMPIE